MKNKPKETENRYFWVAPIVIVALIIFLGQYFMTETEQDSNRVLLETNKGNITIQLYEDMPVTTENFKKLVKEGFYNGIIFHRVIEGFMIQGGDPLGTGVGGPGYTIEDEFVSGHSNLRGTISMANKGISNSGGSQFFINLVDNTYLDWDKPPETSKHPVFGEIIEGMEVVDVIGAVSVDSMKRPLKEIKIIRAQLI